MSKQIIPLFLVGAMAIGTTSVMAAPTPALERLVLRGDWAGVVREATKDPSPDGSVRYLTGHGYLALDRANYAMCMFIGAAAVSGQQVWLSWTVGVTEREPRSAMAHFLRGDALARLGRWSAALEELDKAVTLRSGDPLVLNARASARAADGDWGGAQSDLDAAQKAPHRLLDVRNTMGVLNILQRLDPGVADRVFADVLKRDPKQAMALNGRGAAATADGAVDKARRFYHQAADANPCLVLSFDNLLLLEKTELDRLRQRAAPLLAGIEPGAPVYLNPLGQNTASQLQTAQNQLNSARDQLNLANGLHNLAITGDFLPVVATGLLGGAAALELGPGAAGAEALGTLNTTRAQMLRGAGLSGLAPIVQPLANLFSGNDSFAAASRNVANDLNNLQARLNNPQAFQPNPAQISPPAPRPVQGVDTAPSQNAIDTGHWPVVLQPTLLYSISPKEPH